MLLSQADSYQTEPEIIQLAEMLRGLPIFENLSEDEFKSSLDLARRTLQVSVGQSYTIEEETKHIKWFEEYYKNLGVTRWDRYVDYLKFQKGFPIKVVQSMKDNLFKITDLIGDPNGENFERKGLVVGDVQSGKTANYVGLMNLATDVHYKIIIVLTGTTNTLREQTQIRIEEGLGLNRLNKGVSTIQNANYKDFRNPVYLTSRENDFSTKSRDNFQTSIESTNVPIIIVTKKNSTALENIHSWLVEYSQKKNENHINSSLLLIDDEADFASVNVNKEEDSPTAINRKIRDILKLFTKSSYVGFTATPYANIFIDPETDDEMYGQDLFPKDYIYVLGESDEYVGMQSIFSDEAKKAKNRHMLVSVSNDEVETFLPLKHKKDDGFLNLSPSMAESIDLFLLSNTILDKRGKLNSHRSMLMNMSRFVNMHSQIKVVVTEYLEEAKRDAKLYGKLPLTEAMQHKRLLSLRNSFNKHYKHLEDGITFESLLPEIHSSIHRIKVAIVNAGTKELDYLGNEDEGERVIVIGGFALSRGLTLEGLVISYYYRNSVMYDSLLQMGRWFGYRNGYGDLCRIFMTKKVIDDFKFISLASTELKEDLEINSKRGLTPKEFGIKVRSGQAGLIVTSRSKMRTGKNKTTFADFSKDIVETTVLSVKNENMNRKNKELFTSFIENHKEYLKKNLNNNNKSKQISGLININKAKVIELLKGYSPVTNASKFDTELIIRWLRSNNSKILENWDVAFVTGEEGHIKFNYGNGIIGNSSKRTLNPLDIEEGIYKTSNSRLGSPTDGRIGLTQDQIIRAENLKSEGSVSQKAYFDIEVNRKPIILVYSIVPKNEEVNIEFPIPLLSLGIPDLGRGKSNPINYMVNKIYAAGLEGIETEEE